jgi:uncharacterized protein (TIGR03790 family)
MPTHCRYVISMLLVFTLQRVAFTTEPPSRDVRPENILLVANSAYPGSADLARYYAQKRAIPSKNLFILELPTTEDIDRDCFNTKLQRPIEAKIAEYGNTIRCIVVFSGVPLNIWDPFPVQERISKLKRDVEGIKQGTFQGELKVVEDELAKSEAKAKELAANGASVDSELALLGRDHPLAGHVASPFMNETGWPEGCYWIARLDATNPDDVRSMIDGALAAEKKGLEGIAYFDARGLNGTDGYSVTDEEIRQAALLARKKGFATILDNRPELFGVGECPDAAIYWGWYSLAKYVDSFKFVPGAIAVHIASGECDSLREGPYWCRNLIAHGAAVTLGPTQEPYLEAFPHPDRFLQKLFDGECVGAAYYETAPWLSWKMVLLGDPLYRPFAGGARQGEGSTEKARE